MRPKAPVKYFVGQGLAVKKSMYACTLLLPKAQANMLLSCGLAFICTNTNNMAIHM